MPVLRGAAIALTLSALWLSPSVAAERAADAPVMLPSDQPMHSRSIPVKIRMRDGVMLAADLYLPQAKGRYPVIIEVTPYGKRGDTSFVAERDYWPDNGYAFMIVDARGQHDSGGTFTFMKDAIDDGYDIVEWAGVQDWSDGKVGMRGSSYSGTYPWYAAKNAPPHLKCINPNATAVRSFDELPYSGGAFKEGWALPWISSLSDSGVKPGTRVDWDKVLKHRPLMTADEAAFGVKMKTYRELLAHPTLDAFWRPVNFTASDYARIKIPSLAFSAWFDGTLPGTIHSYQQMRAHSPAAHDQFLIVGPWEHLTAPDGGWDYMSGEQVRKVGDLTFPANAFLPGQRITRQFFDWCLKGGPRPEAASARMYLTGADTWLNLPDYPTKATVMTPMYLSSGGDALGRQGRGRLTPSIPGAEPADRYVFNPADPFPSMVMRGGKPFNLQSMPVDISSLLDRPDVLVYVGAPLEKALTVLGNVRVELFAASSARETDFTAHIEDVAPDGTAVKLGPQSGGIVRARYRKSYVKPTLLTPGKVERYSINLFDIGHLFQPGHRIRISISSGAWPFHSVNPNTGRPIATDTSAPIRATQTIFHDRVRPSHVLLPVMADQ